MKLLDMAIVSILSGAALFVVYTFWSDSKSIAQDGGNERLARFDSVVVHSPGCPEMYKPKQFKLLSDYVIGRDGKIEETVNFKAKESGEVREKRIDVSMEDTKSPIARDALMRLIKKLSAEYKISRNSILCHRCAASR